MSYFYDVSHIRKATAMKIELSDLKSLPSLFGLCLVGGILLLACEKDDICTEADTPLLVLTFFDSESPAEPKSVTRLRVIGLGNSAVADTFADRSNRDSIALPLRLDTGRTGFVFIFQSENDSEGAETGNRDTLYFDYTTREVFASRACGFVVQYEDLQAEAPADDDTWIEEVEIIQASVTTSESAHVSIYH